MSNPTHSATFDTVTTPLVRSSVWLGNADLAGIVGSTGETAKPTSLAGLALEASGGSVQIDCELVPVNDLADLDALISQLPRFELAFVSVEPGFVRDTELPIGHAENIATAHLIKAVQTLRATGTYVFLVLASTLVGPVCPAGTRPPESLSLHGRNIAAIDAAAKTGASTIDLDRLVAEIGGRVAVTGPCEYAECLNVSARNEVVRILDHYRLLSRDSTPVAQMSPRSVVT